MDFILTNVGVDFIFTIFGVSSSYAVGVYRRIPP